MSKCAFVKAFPIFASLALVTAIAGTMGCSGDGSDEVPALIAQFSDESENGMVAANAMYRLVEIGEPAVPALTEAVGSSDVRVKLMALNTLALLGSKAAPALPAIEEASKHPDKDVQARALNAKDAVAGGA